MFNALLIKRLIMVQSHDIIVKSDFQKIKNKKLFEKLKLDEEFRNIEYNEENGGLKAESIHHNNTEKGEKFFKEENGGIGYSGPQLEKFCQDELFRTGHSCILMGENIPKGDGTFLTALDAIIDDKRMDIKSVTENSTSYRNQITSKNKQLVKWREQTNNESDISLCLYFHKPEYFSMDKIILTKAQLKPKMRDKGFVVRELYCVIRGEKNIYIFDLIE